MDGIDFSLRFRLKSAGSSQLIKPASAPPLAGCSGVFRLGGCVERIETWWQGILMGACFGLVVFLIGSLPVYLLNYASFAVSSHVIQAWVVQSLCQYVFAGAALGLYSVWAS